jgi:hypothetical protein
LIIGTWSDFICVVWKHEATLEGVGELERAVEAFATAKQEGFAVLVVVEPNAPAPSAATRQAIANSLRRGAGRVHCSAVVFEAAGFRGSAVRAVVAGMTMLAKQPYPHRVFDSVTAAATWMVAEGPSRWRHLAPALVSAMTQLRRGTA